jgi:RNA polymerase subunit RPABC4/transcription elongation factor Spt4
MYSESDDELHEYEYPDDDQDDDFDDPDNYSSDCPNCKAAVYEDSEYCPSCGYFITHSTSPFAGRSALWTGLGILGIVVVIAALVFGSM